MKHRVYGTLAMLVLLVVVGVAQLRPEPVEAAWVNPVKPHQVFLPMLFCQDCQPNPHAEHEMAQRMKAVEIYNRYRVQYNCPVAEIDERLMRGAQAWAYHTAYVESVHAPPYFYDHYGFYYMVGEGLAIGASASEAMEGWYLSPYHKGLIVNCRYSDTHKYKIGVGAAFIGGTYAWVLVVSAINPVDGFERAPLR